MMEEASHQRSSQTLLFFAFHKTYWTSVIPGKGFLCCSILCNFCSVEMFCGFIIACLYPYVISKTGHVAIFWKQVWLREMYGLYWQFWKQVWSPFNPGAAYSAALSCARTSFCLLGASFLRELKREELPRLYFKIMFLQEQYVINEGFELVVGMISLCCKCPQTKQGKVM